MHLDFSNPENPGNPGNSDISGNPGNSGNIVIRSRIPNSLVLRTRFSLREIKKNEIHKSKLALTVITTCSKISITLH